eukprot:Opistho-1_new@99009
MSMAGSPSDDVGEPSSYRPGSAAAGHRRIAFALRRAPPFLQGAGQPVFDADLARDLHRIDGLCRRCAGSGRRNQGLPPRQLGRPVWHRARTRPSVGADAGADFGAGDCGADLLAGTLAQGRPAFPHPVPVPADGAQRCIPDRRPVQPVRLLRGFPGCLLWPCPAWFGHTAGQGGSALCGHQSRRRVAVPDRRQPDLRRHRHVEHGRPRTADSPRRRRQPHAAGGGRGHSRHRFPDQGWHVATRLLAAHHLQRRGGAGGGDLRHAEQGRHLYPAAPVTAAVRGERRPHRRLRRALAALRRHGDDRLRRDRRPRLTGHGTAGRLPCTLR